MGSTSHESVFSLRPRDQRTIAALLLAALLMVGGYWLVGKLCHGWIDWDKVEHRQIEFLVRVNEASWIELAELPDIGETLAKRIVEYREEHGPFHDANELLKVTGIGPKKLAGIRPHLVF